MKPGIARVAGVKGVADVDADGYPEGQHACCWFPSRRAVARHAPARLVRFKLREFRLRASRRNPALGDRATASAR